MNRIGFMMFTKFFLRFQRVMTKLAINAPVSSLMGHYETKGDVDGKANAEIVAIAEECFGEFK